METKSESKYERLRKIGIGSYGVVFKCVNRQSGQVVAIKRYSENDTDPIIRKIAMREVRMLRQLKHSNLINLIEVFRRKRRLHLVFDYCELTVLDVIEKYGNSCPINLIKKIVWQIVNGINYCHAHNCIHRDIKPENILINQAGVVKLCDFGFARQLNNGSYLQNNSFPSKTSGGQQISMGLRADEVEKENVVEHDERQALTEYVATRWYRAPELLIGEVYYDFKIDIWAIGCVAAELMRGEPVWPGQTDLDQLFMIKSSLGPLTSSQMHTLLTQNLYDQTNIERLMAQTRSSADSIERKLPVRIGQLGLEFVSACLQMDPQLRPPSDELLYHGYIQSSRMFQFMKEASGTGAVASGRPGEGHLTAGGNQQHLNQPLIEPENSRRSNSQSLMLATNGQLPPPTTTTTTNNNNTATTTTTSKRLVQVDGGSSPSGVELPVAKRVNTNKLDQVTPKRGNGRAERKQVGLTTIYQAQVPLSNKESTKSRHSRVATNSEMEKSPLKVSNFHSRLPNALPGVANNGYNKGRALDMSASSSSNVSDTIINHSNNNRTTIKTNSYLPTLVHQPVKHRISKPGDSRQSNTTITTTTTSKI